MFKRIPMKTRVDDAIYQASLDLMEAEAAFESATANRAKLIARLDRLNRYRDQLRKDAENGSQSDRPAGG